VRQWHKDGIAIDDVELGDLASSDCDALCELDGVRLRFTAETVAQQPWQPVAAHGAAVVLTLRQIDCPQAADPIYLVEYTDAGPLASATCAARQCRQLADAVEITDRTARRYICTELFRRAQDIIGGDQAA